MENWQEILDTLQYVEPFITAHEVSEQYSISPQKASGLLRQMEGKNLITSKRVKAGRGEVKCYFIKKEKSDIVC